ncbi:hypothetical protein [Vagococcus fluvialis]|uniref:hypothetical protein n=1 Tax=Vagococcus fluvialis TaxID=2738 RepID=UPI003B5C69B2
MELNSYYQDRGMMKYNGFYLSEHTSSLEKEKNNRYAVISGKDEMTLETIYEVIDYSFFKNEQVSIQLNIKDIEGNFLPDVYGFIKGYDELGIYIDHMKIPLEQIRHIVILETTKWYQ